MKYMFSNINTETIENVEGKYVEVKLFNGSIIRGNIELGNGGIYNPKWCTVGNVSFKISNIKTLEVM